MTTVHQDDERFLDHRIPHEPEAFVEQLHVVLEYPLLVDLIERRDEVIADSG
jgi:hypothetical protein